MTVTVIIGWYGNNEYWQPLIDRAVSSVINQSVPADLIVVCRGKDLQSARNTVGLDAYTDAIIFLDADDELDDDYIKNMVNGSGDIRVPSVHNYYEDGTCMRDQRWYTPRNLIDGQNYIVIGAMINAKLFKKVGGFRNLPSLEDYDLWLRMEEAGSLIRQCTDAIYIIHRRNVTTRSANQNILLNQIVDEANKRRKIT